MVELKWNKSTDTAIEQIQDKKYPDSILEYTGDILLVGINYDKKTKEHECRIEKIKKQKTECREEKRHIMDSGIHDMAFFIFRQI